MFVLCGLSCWIDFIAPAELYFILLVVTRYVSLMLFVIPLYFLVEGGIFA